MSLFYPFWQQTRAADSSDAEETDEYPSAGRLVLPISGDTLLVEFRPSLPRTTGLVYKARLRTTGIRRLIVDSLRPIAADGPPIEEVVKPQMPAVVSFVQADVLYRFETTVISSTDLAGETTTVSFARPRYVTRIQRRQFYRVPIETSTSFYCISGEHASELATGRILNLSAGGLLLATLREVTEGEKVVMRVPMGRDGYPTDIKAEALECIPAHGKMAGYHVRFRFDNGKDISLSEEEQEGINLYLYEQQRMMLRVRKLMRGKA